VFSNTISTNYGSGITFDDYPYDVKVYHNDFINNTSQVSIIRAGCTHVWDDSYPSGGNSWSDYTSTDIYSGPDQDQPGSDGIGDTPYIIDANNKDNYPLIRPWIHPREPRTWTVDDDGPADFSNIQEAINAASQGDTIFVYKGTYYENVVMNKSLCTLVGESQSTTIIDGGSTGSVVTVTAGRVRISNFTIQHATYGVTVDTMGKVVIENNEISGNSESGIMIRGQSNVLIKNNTIKQNKNGIATDASNTHSGITIVGNSILSNRENGIYLYSYSSSYNPDYSYSYAYIYDVNITSNMISSNQGNGVYLYSYTFSTSYTPYSGSYSYSYVYDIDITSNTISANQGNGVYLHSNSYSSSSSSTISQSYVYDINMTGNTISSNQDGIYLYSESSPYSEYADSSSYVDDINMTGNTISSNRGSGVYLHSDSYTSYSGYSSSYSYVDDINMTGNMISSNQGNGVYLYSYSGYSSSYSYIDDVNMTGNTISANRGSGVYLYSDSYSAYSSTYSYIDDVNMTGNAISSNKGLGIYNYAKDHTSGIEFDLLFTYNRIHSNSQGMLIEGGIIANLTQNSIAYNINEGVLFNASQNNEAHYNDIYGNGYGMKVSNGATVDAERNYWGNSSGPYHESLNPDGKGNSVNGNGTDLDFIPFLTNPVDSTPPTTLHDYDGLWHTTEFTINLTATDDMSGVAETYYKINDGPTKTVSINEQPHITTEGANNTLEFWSVDNVGNEESHHILTGIELDKTAPTGSIIINNGDAYTTSTSVTLTLSAADETSGISEMRFSNDNTAYTEWQAYAASKLWTLQDGDGTKTVYVQFRDHAGLISTYSDAITLDTQRPTGSITIAEGAAYTNSSVVTLTLSATDATSGVAQMRFSNDNVTWSDWEPYTTSKSWTLRTGDDLKGVTVQYKDNAGLISSYSDSIILDTIQPTAKAGDDQTVNEDISVSFDASASADENGISTYTWTFTDITPQTLTGKNPTYTFLTPGTYTITLKATDPAGNTATDTVIITVLDITKPIANAGSDRTVNEDTQITLDGSASSDNVAITTYTWTFTDVTIKTLTGQKPTYTFNTPGVYTMTLNVTDAAGNWATDTVVITVLDITKPVANAGSDKTINVGTAVTFDAGGSTDNVGIVSYEWNFGDGTTGTGIKATHTYASQGTYTATLTVKDSAGNTATDSITITVHAAEGIPMWIIGAAIAAVALATAAATLILWKRRK
jgi:parallel beta-helix repeat protein